MFPNFLRYRFVVNNAANLDSVKVFVKELKDVQTITPQKLSEADVKVSLHLHQLDSNWKTTTKSLCRDFQFATFKQAFVFMNTVSAMADEMQHYPKWINVYNKISVDITTQDVSGISIKDVILAHLMESIAKDIISQNFEHIGELSRISANALLQNWNHNFTNYQEIMKKNIHNL